MRIRCMDLSSQLPLGYFETLQPVDVAPFTVQFATKVMQLILNLDTGSHTAGFVTGVELLFAFLPDGGEVPLQHTAGGQLTFVEPSAPRAGGLIRLTIATAVKTFKMALLRFF